MLRRRSAESRPAVRRPAPRTAVRRPARPPRPVAAPMAPSRPAGGLGDNASQSVRLSAPSRRTRWGTGRRSRHSSPRRRWRRGLRVSPCPSHSRRRNASVNRPIRSLLSPEKREQLSALRRAGAESHGWLACCLPLALSRRVAKTICEVQQRGSTRAVTSIRCGRRRPSRWCRLTPPGPSHA